MVNYCSATFKSPNVLWWLFLAFIRLHVFLCTTTGLWKLYCSVLLHLIHMNFAFCDNNFAFWPKTFLTQVLPITSLKVTPIKKQNNYRQNAYFKVLNVLQNSVFCIQIFRSGIVSQKVGVYRLSEIVVDASGGSSRVRRHFSLKITFCLSTHSQMSVQSKACSKPPIIIVLLLSGYGVRVVWIAGFFDTWRWCDKYNIKICMLSGKATLVLIVLRSLHKFGRVI